MTYWNAEYYEFGLMFLDRFPIVKKGMKKAADEAAAV